MIEKVGQALQELAARKGMLPERARKDLEQHIGEYEKLIKKMAHKYVRTRVEYEDLVQEAMIGLILADRDFDPSRSNDFHTYAIYRMKGKMYEYCIGNDSPIYVPTHIAKAASYVKQMQRLLDREPCFSYNNEVDIESIIRVEKHPVESQMSENAQADLKEIKRKMARIAHNSKMEYEKLADLALISLSSIISDEALVKVPRDSDRVEDVILGGEVRTQLREMLGDKRLMVLEMRAQDWTYREIAERLYAMGYKNKSGGVISRQAVKGILDDTLKTIRKSKFYKNLLDEEEMYGEE